MNNIVGTYGLHLDRVVYNPTVVIPFLVALVILVILVTIVIMKKK